MADVCCSLNAVQTITLYCFEAFCIIINSDGELVEGNEEDISDMLSAVASCEEDNNSLN